eukprot:802528-Prorocentrum_lima.AAC.1
MKAIGGRVCLEPASATKEGLLIKSPPTDRPPCTSAPLKAAPTSKLPAWRIDIDEDDTWTWHHIDKLVFGIVSDDDS